MLLNSLKDLDKLMVLCRKRGVKSIKIDGIEFTMDDSVEYDTTGSTTRKFNIAPGLPDIPGSLEQNARIISDFPTEEQLMFGSSDPGVWSQHRSPEEILKGDI